MIAYWRRKKKAKRDALIAKMIETQVAEFHRNVEMVSGVNDLSRGKTPWVDRGDD